MAIKRSREKGRCVFKMALFLQKHNYYFDIRLSVISSLQITPAILIVKFTDQCLIIFYSCRSNYLHERNSRKIFVVNSFNDLTRHTFAYRYQRVNVL